METCDDSIFGKYWREISALVDKYAANGVRQHSAEWHNLRITTVGGSQIAALIGKNPYENPYKLLLTKLGRNPFKSSPVTQWGSLFEYLIRAHVEYTLMCKVVGADLFMFGDYDGVSYSPDGMGVVLTDRLKAVLPPAHAAAINADETSIWSKVLFELKCPYVRQLKGVPPAYYLPQVKYGLDVIGPVLNFGIFIEAVFRRCAFADLGFNNKFNTQISAWGATNSAPLSVGYIGFRIGKITQDAVEPLKLFRAKVLSIGGTVSYVDAGQCSLDLFEIVLHLWHIGTFIADYTNVWRTEAAFAEGIQPPAHLVILPWKLFRVDYHLVRREHGFLTGCLPVVADFIKNVKLCLDETNEGKRSALVNEYARQYVGDFE